MPDLVTDQTSAHDLVHGYLPAGWSVERWQAAQADPTQHGELTAAAAASCATHVQAMLEFQALGVKVVDYGNNIRQVALDQGVRNAFDFPGFVPAYIRPLFCEGKGRSAGSRCQATPRTSTRPTRRSSSFSRRTPMCIAGSTWPANASLSRACRRASAGSGSASAILPGWRSTTWCAPAN